MPLETKLRLEGDASPSKPFVLRGIGGEGTTIRVHAAHETAPLGFVLVGLGGASLLATPFLAVAGAADCGFVVGQSSCSSGFWPAVAVTGIAGAALLGIGIALAVAAGKTRVDGRGVVPVSRAHSAGGDTRLDSPTILGSAPVLPVFHASF